MASLPVMGLLPSTIYAREAFLHISFSAADLLEIYVPFVRHTAIDVTDARKRAVTCATFPRRPSLNGVFLSTMRRSATVSRVERAHYEATSHAVAKKALMDDRSQAYEEIIGPIEDRMLRSIWRITRDAHDAEDAMQNALVTLWKRWNQLRRHASPQALVLKICVDAALDVARRRVRDRRKIESNDPASHPADGLRLPLEELANSELRREVLAAIARLSRRQAVTVMLRAFEELPYNQIAAALGCTEATARKHFGRACAQLRLALARHQPNVSIGGSHDRSRR